MILDMTRRKTSSRFKAWQAIIVALITAAATVVAALIATHGTTSNTSASTLPSPLRPPAPPTPAPSHLEISRVSFSIDNGKVVVIVAGIYHPQDGDGYLYAIVRPSRVPFGTANWLVSEPVTPNKNGQWIATVTLTTPRQRVTVFAVLAGGCPPGGTCAAPSEVIRSEIQAGGLDNVGDYMTPALVTS
jgi:hypothetical protein